VGSHHLGPWRVDVEWRDGVRRLLPETALARAVGAALDAAGAPEPASIAVENFVYSSLPWPAFVQQI
jgi:hypothetical protein